MLKVGVHNDETVEGYKRKPVCDMRERIAVVAACRYVDAVIPNTPEAESKALRINHQVAAWCLNYWTDTNPGGKAFYNKLANRAFHQALLHEVSECSWDPITQTVTSPGAQSELAAIADSRTRIG